MCAKCLPVCSTMEVRQSRRHGPSVAALEGGRYEVARCQEVQHADPSQGLRGRTRGPLPSWLPRRTHVCRNRRDRRSAERQRDVRVVRPPRRPPGRRLQSRGTRGPAAGARGHQPHRTRIALDTPDILTKFQMPDGESDHDLATAGRQFAEDAGPLARDFVAHGLPESFVADLRAALATFERAISGRALGQETHVGARADITAALDLAFATLPRLDAIVENTVGGDPNALAAWRLARNVGRTPTRSGGPAPAAQTPALAGASPSAVPAPATIPDRLTPPALPPATPAV